MSKTKLSIGDEIIVLSKRRKAKCNAIVTNIFKRDGLELIHYIRADRFVGIIKPCRTERTGRHFKFDAWEVEEQEDGRKE